MKFLILNILILCSILTFSQERTNWTEYDTLVDINGLVSLKVSTYRDSVFYRSFRTTIVDTTVEIKRAGFLWMKRYRIETHVYGPKWDYRYSEKAKNTLICTEPYGVSFITRLK